MTFLGIDLTCSGSRPSAIVALKHTGAQRVAPPRVAYWGQVAEDVDIISVVLSLKPGVVAIDAPLSLPPGLHCLEESCPCTASRPFRSAERELHRLGFGLFYTNKKSIIKKMVYRGIGLSAALAQQGYKVLEVYPYAAKVRLGGKPIPKKTTPQGMAFLSEHLARILPSAAPYLPSLTHDMADAALAAYTAYLYSQARAELVGAPDEGQICIPIGAG